VEKSRGNENEKRKKSKKRVETIREMGKKETRE